MRLAPILLVALAGRALAAPCDGRDAALVVRAGEHRLYLCAGGHAVGEHAVSLGRGGLGKSAEGDGKTPLGTYRLGAPRPSRDYRTFIPVGYPSPAERAR